MNSLLFALEMAPYWAFGLCMFIAIYFSSHRSLLRVDWPVVRKFAFTLSVVIVLRYFVLKLLASPTDVFNLIAIVSWIPTWSTACVPWEDLVHTVPLGFLGRVLPDNYFCRAIRIFAMLVLMVDFGMGHIYQGVFVATLLTLYVPVTLHYGRKFGFGTVMLCHIIYDFLTVVLIKYLI